MDTPPLPDEVSVAAETSTTPPPEPTDPSGDSEWVRLWNNVRDALFALPSRFESTLSVSGVLATDLFTFNSSLGATIEQQVVEQLNRLRTTWDPDERYSLYQFDRQAQRFPDVVLRTTAPGRDPAPLLGIELKGWYVLAKEREPSFRYVVTPAVCTEYDLLVVFPWALSEVVSGSPKLFTPFVFGARFAAEYRNWHWEHRRRTGRDRRIRLSTVTTHYPAKSELIADRAVHDDGGNFGRIARTDLMNDHIAELFKQTSSGIPLDAWQKFFRVFTEADPQAGSIGSSISSLGTVVRPQPRSRPRTSRPSGTSSEGSLRSSPDAFPKPLYSSSHAPSQTPPGWRHVARQNEDAAVR